MKTKFYFLVTISIVFTILFSSCTYNENCVCPTSPKIYSYYYTIHKNDWQSAERFHWFKRLDVPEITIPVIEKGSVLVYYKTSINTWVLLPYSTTLSNSDGIIYNEEIWSGFALGTVDIDYVYTNPQDPTPPNKLELKVVVIDR